MSTLVSNKTAQVQNVRVTDSTLRVDLEDGPFRLGSAGLVPTAAARSSQGAQHVAAMWSRAGHSLAASG